MSRLIKLISQYVDQRDQSHDMSIKIFGRNEKSSYDISNLCVPANNTDIQIFPESIDHCETVSRVESDEGMSELIKFIRPYVDKRDPSYDMNIKIFGRKSFYDASNLCVPANSTNIQIFPEPINYINLQDIESDKGSVQTFCAGMRNLLVYGTKCKISGKIICEDPNATVYVGNNVWFGPDSSIEAATIIKFDEDVDKIKSNNDIPTVAKAYLINGL